MTNIWGIVLDEPNNVSENGCASIFRLKRKRGILFWWTLLKELVCVFGIFRQNFSLSLDCRENLSLSINPLERRGLWVPVNGPFRKKRSLGLCQWTIQKEEVSGSLSLDPLERRGLWVSVNGPFRKKRSLGPCQWTLQKEEVSGSLSLDPLERRGLWVSVTAPFIKKYVCLCD